MKLIDADKLKEELEVNGLGYQYYMLDNASTVEAIPIEWLEDYIQNNTATLEMGKAVKDFENMILRSLIDKWRSENDLPDR